MTANFYPPLLNDELSIAFAGFTNFLPLGAGGQGTVFSCLDSDGEKRALKICISSALSPDERILREIRKLELIRSRNVVQIFSHGSTVIRGNTYLFSFSELIDGTDLTKVTLPLQEADIKSLLLDVARGIEALWKERTVHRDIKPGNVLRRRDGSWVLIDLGIAKHLGEQTITGGWIGSRGYMSPEQAKGNGDLTYRSDLFALGILAYLVATGVHPFGMIQDMIGRAVPTNPKFHNSRLSQKLNKIIMQLLKVRAVDRSPNFPQLISVIEEL